MLEFQVHSLRFGLFRSISFLITRFTNARREVYIAGVRKYYIDNTVCFASCCCFSSRPIVDEVHDPREGSSGSGGEPPAHSYEVSKLRGNELAVPHQNLMILLLVYELHRRWVLRTLEGSWRSTPYYRKFFIFAK